jgi:hypothetical protein
MKKASIVLFIGILLLSLAGISLTNKVYSNGESSAREKKIKDSIEHKKSIDDSLLIAQKSKDLFELAEVNINGKNIYIREYNSIPELRKFELSIVDSVKNEVVQSLFYGQYRVVIDPKCKSPIVSGIQRTKDGEFTGLNSLDTHNVPILIYYYTSEIPIYISNK